MAKKTPKIIEMQFNCPDRTSVNKILYELLADNLIVAAHHVEHITTYMWDDEKISKEEFAVKVRCIPERVEAIIEIIEDNHPYSSPAIVWTEVNTTVGYAKWISGEVAIVT